MVRQATDGGDSPLVCFSEKAKFVKSITFNGRELSNWRLSWSDLMSGGRLVFEMEE